MARPRDGQARVVDAPLRRRDRARRARPAGRAAHGRCGDPSPAGRQRGRPPRRHRQPAAPRSIRASTYGSATSPRRPTPRSLARTATSSASGPTCGSATARRSISKPTCSPRAPVWPGPRPGTGSTTVDVDGTLVMIGAGSANGVTPLPGERVRSTTAQADAADRAAPHAHLDGDRAEGHACPAVGDWVDLQRPLTLRRSTSCYGCDHHPDADPGADRARRRARHGDGRRRHHELPRLSDRRGGARGGWPYDLFDTWIGPLSTRFAATFVLTAGVGVTLMTRSAVGDPARTAELRWTAGPPRAACCTGSGWRSTSSGRARSCRTTARCSCSPPVMFTLSSRWLIAIGVVAAIGGVARAVVAVRAQIDGHDTSWLTNPGPSSPAGC